MATIQEVNKALEAIVRHLPVLSSEAAKVLNRGNEQLKRKAANRLIAEALGVMDLPTSARKTIAAGLQPVADSTLSVGRHIRFTKAQDEEILKECDETGLDYSTVIRKRLFGSQTP